MRRATHSLLFVGIVSGILIFGRSTQLGSDDKSYNILHARQATSTRGGTTVVLPPTSVPTATTDTTSTTTSSSTTSTTSSTTSSSSTTTSSSSITTSSASSTTSQSLSVSSALTTGPAGTSIVVTTLTSPATTSPVQTSAPASSPSDSNSSISPGSIIGLSVAGGIAVLGILGFLIWKFTRKRFTAFDDNEAIKWPELNTHDSDSHALPVNSTGRAGFETGSEVDVSRVDSRSGYAPSVATTSTPDVSADPYAVPPLPHLNPNQPYRDDPGSGYYDPYPGPVPAGFHDGTSLDGHMPGYRPDAIPMTQMAPGRARSPGPQMSYDAGIPAIGRRSPGPQTGRMSPGPQAGRMSPGPQAALGSGMPGGMLERTMSPGPANAYAGGAPIAGRQSPGPYNAYGPR